MEIVNYLLSAEHQTELARTKGKIPSLKDEAVRKQLFADMKVKNVGYYEAIYANPFAPLAPKTIYDESVRKILSNTKSMLELATGKTDINTFMRTTEEKANKELERERKK
jgi:hypothetical protein